MKNMKIRIAATLLICALFAGSASADELTVVPRAAVTDEIGTRQVSFMAKETGTGRHCILAESDLETRHAPWSTFKIPNLLIALEKGIAADLSAPRAWDKGRRPRSAFWPEDWAQDQTLKTAFQRSVVWYFRDIAQDVGTAAYREVLTAWDYGNAAVPGGSDQFWLDRSLQISIREQVSFLDRLLTGDLEVSPKALAALTEASLAGEIGDGTLHGKTGAGTVERGNFDGPFEGWYVGWVALPDHPPTVFALHVRGDSFAEIRAFRKDFTVTLLDQCNSVPNR
ncbi:class D beta-lactamase [Actibacterium sp. 188UL27-1]|uniref:class D beta-lactamase n=1 Tax=Actibacterium sp. 188UL27-1 TaxID=2786961 RepID=UPI00195D4DDA|nr:class D beta-lactamase [Actibacterium sp. 188UL27-1]MBM7067724.1 class D beta-lactamase [Actibacterium sp. 188UL27-1]